MPQSFQLCAAIASLAIEAQFVHVNALPQYKVWCDIYAYRFDVALINESRSKFVTMQSVGCYDFCLLLMVIAVINSSLSIAKQDGGLIMLPLKP